MPNVNRRDPNAPAAPAGAASPPSPTVGAPTANKPATPAGPVDLMVDNVKLKVGVDGALSLGSGHSLTDQIIAAKAAALRSLDAQPFGKVTDIPLLRNIASNAAHLHEALLKTPKTDAEALEFRSGRAAALTLMQAAARRAGALGDTATRDALALGMMISIKNEPYRPLKDFMFEQAISRAQSKELPPVESAREVLYPDSFPYDRWLQDGVIKIKHYTDNNGSPRSSSIEFYEDRGFTKEDKPDGSTLMTRAASGQKPKIEVTIPPAPTKDAPPALFESMGDPSTEIIVYFGHAGYGKRVEDAIAKGVAGTGDAKLVMLMQCYGEGSIESLNRAFPDAQLISTRGSSTDTFDFPTLTHVLDGIDKRSKTAEIEKANIVDFNKFVAATPWMKETAKEHPIEKQYFYPHSRSAILPKLDRDRDGIRDDSDPVFNVVFPKRVDAAGGYDPLEPGVPLDSLDGSATSAATNQLNLFARYVKLPDGLFKNKIPWHAEMFAPAGFYEGSPNDLRAFSFTIDPLTNRVMVAVNSLYAHAKPDALGRMLAIEAGQFIGEKAGLDKAKTATLSLSMLERMLHQEGAVAMTDPESVPEPLSPVEERLFDKRYQLPISFADLKKATGNPDDFVVSSFESINTLVSGNPAMQKFTAQSPSRATTPHPVPPHFMLAGMHDQAALQDVVNRLGIKATVDPASNPSGMWFNPRSSQIITVKDAAGKTSIISLGVDSENVVRAVSIIAPV